MILGGLLSSNPCKLESRYVKKPRLFILRTTGVIGFNWQTSIEKTVCRDASFSLSYKN